jgi:hypothetical protein
MVLLRSRPQLPVVGTPVGDAWQPSVDLTPDNGKPGNWSFPQEALISVTADAVEVAFRWRPFSFAIPHCFRWKLFFNCGDTQWKQSGRRLWSHFSDQPGRHPGTAGGSVRQRRRV